MKAREDKLGCLSCPTPWVGVGGNCTHKCSDIEIPSQAKTFCIQCPVGKRFVRGICSTCAEGQEMRNVSGVSTCVDCPLGLFGTPEQPCQRCPTGTESDKVTKSTTCDQCDPGKYAGSDDVRCVRCPSGQIAAEPGSMECSSCPDPLIAMPDGRQCGACEVGKVGTGGNCTECPDGFAPNTYTSGTYCVNCAKLDGGPYVSVGGRCVTCPPGSKESIQGCEECGAGTYSPLGKACISCDLGMVPSQTIGAFSCVPCAAGRFAATAMERCEVCAQGKFSEAGATSCRTCEPGTEVIDRTSCRRCAVGRVSPFGVRCSSCGNNSVSNAEQTGCYCLDGFTTKGNLPLEVGEACIDVDECAINSGGCHPLSTHCINEPGTHRCGECAVGFEGDGFDCFQIVTPWANAPGASTLSTAPSMEAVLEFQTSPAVLDENSALHAEFMTALLWDLSNFLTVPASAIEVASLTLSGRRQLLDEVSIQVSIVFESGAHGPASAIIAPLAAALKGNGTLINGRDLYAGIATRKLLPGQSIAFVERTRMVCPADSFRVYEQGQAIDRCDKCFPGKEPADNSCRPCDSGGRRLISTHGMACVPCAAGQQANSLLTYCESCFVSGMNHYATAVTAAAGELCRACPGGKVVSHDRTGCECRPGYFDPIGLTKKFLDFGVTSCVQRDRSTSLVLPATGECAFSFDHHVISPICLSLTTRNTSADVVTPPGWWRENLESTNLYECPMKEFCKDAHCIPSRAGILCGGCAAGWIAPTATSSDCWVCPQEAAAVLWIVLGVGIFLTGLLLIDRGNLRLFRTLDTPDAALGKTVNTRHKMAVARMLIDWSVSNYHVISVGPWPAAWRVAFWWGGALGDPAAALMPFGCLLKITSFAWADLSATIAMCFPAIVVGVTGARLVCLCCCQRCGCCRSQIPAIRRSDAMYGTLVACLCTFFPAVVRHAILLMSCGSTHHDEHLVEAVSIPGMACSTRQSTAWLALILTVFGSSFCVWCTAHSGLRRRVAFFGYGVEPKLWWWEMVVGSGRKLLTTALLAYFGRRSPTLALCSCGAATLGGLAMQLHHRPYETSLLHNLELRCISSHVAMCLCGLLFVADAAAPPQFGTAGTLHTSTLGNQETVEQFTMVFAALVCFFQVAVGWALVSFLLHLERKNGSLCCRRRTAVTFVDVVDTAISDAKPKKKYLWGALADQRKAEKALDAQIALRLINTATAVTQLESAIEALKETALALPDRGVRVQELQALLQQELRIANRHARAVQRVSPGFDLEKIDLAHWTEDVGLESIAVPQQKQLAAIDESCDDNDAEDDKPVVEDSKKTSGLRSILRRHLTVASLLPGQQKAVAEEAAKEAEEAERILGLFSAQIERSGVRGAIFSDKVESAPEPSVASPGRFAALRAAADAADDSSQSQNNVGVAQAQRAHQLRVQAAIERIEKDQKARERKNRARASNQGGGGGLRLHKRPGMITPVGGDAGDGDGDGLEIIEA